MYPGRTGSHPGGLTEKESDEAAKTFAATMVRGWSRLLIEAVGVRNTWERAASGEVGRRQRAEDSREIVRTLLRAWREVVDDVRAGAAKWNQRWRQQAHVERPMSITHTCGCNYQSGHRVQFWQHQQECKRQASGIDMSAVDPLATAPVQMQTHTLARRVAFSTDGLSHWATETGWRLRVLLTWMRLVRGGKVKKGRRQYPMWREAERNRIIDLTRRYRLETGNEQGQDGTSRMTKTYAWGEQEAMSAAHNGMTSGAAAVLARRSVTGSSPGPSSAARSDGALGTANAPRLQVRTPHRRQNGADGRLRLNDQAKVRLADRLGVGWRREPFGDG